jgi:hypothetical protein
MEFQEKKSKLVSECQICGNADLQSILFLGYLPPVNTMPPIGARPEEQPSFPAELLRCPSCTLVQLGCVVDPTLLFPESYPYTSSTTRILRENFAELATEVPSFIELTQKDLVVDIGSNDGNLLSNFKDGSRVLGVTPEKIGEIAVERGIPTLFSYFTAEAAQSIVQAHGKARLVTATNVFAHIDQIHDVLSGILDILEDDGVFVSESHYLLPLVETNQYDTIYHEHLRYYSLTSLKALFDQHGLEILHAKRIPTHGGSIRVYAARKGEHPPQPTPAAIFDEEREALSEEGLRQFGQRVVQSKLELMAMLAELKREGKRLVGISAPSRASTLINYAGIDEGILDAVLEIPGSHKIGKMVPGTRIPVVDEAMLFNDPPDVALVFSWHIAEELVPKLRAKGFKGRFLVPLPMPHFED